MSLLDDARLIQDVYGKPARHVFVACFHPTTQQGGEGCHRFMSCHAGGEERCGFMPHEHYIEGDPMLSMAKIVAALEAAERVAAAWTSDERVIAGNTEPISPYARLAQFSDVFAGVRTLRAVLEGDA
jgi:hypothetical protein